MQHVSQKRKPFSALPKRHKEFIREYVRSGDARASFVKVGYKDDKNVMPKARALFQKLTPYIDAELKKYVKSTELGVLGLAIVKEIASDEKQQGAVRLNAAKELIHRAIPEEPKVSEIHHTHSQKELSNDELEARIRKLSDKLFIEAKDVTGEEYGIQVEGPPNKREEETQAQVTLLYSQGEAQGEAQG